MARIIVGSYVIRFPVGGYVSWVAQWLVGFHRLGHEVYFVEKSGYPNSCFNPVTRVHSDDCSYGVSVFRDFLARFGLEARWCYVDAAGDYYGLSKEKIEAVFDSADLLVDMGSHGAWLEEARNIGATVLVDGEPGFRQFVFQERLGWGRPIPEYDYYYTVGANIGTEKSMVPTLGLQWRPIFDPVVTELFDAAPNPASNAPFTTVMTWEAHRKIHFNGLTYGQKNVELLKFIELPAKTKAAFEIAVSGDPPLGELVTAGWTLRDSFAVTMSFDSWSDYIRRSRGEFSVCKNVFVATNSGFFSDRSAAYLASGRPVVLQDTGFSSHLPCGRGLFAFQTLEDAVMAIEAIQENYDAHSRAAREIAAEHLESSKVLGKFLREVGL